MTGQEIVKALRAGSTGGGFMKSPILCRMGLHKLNKYMYVQVTRRRSNRHGGKYHTNYAICERCGKLCYRVRRFQKLGVAQIAGSAKGRRQA